MPIYFTSSINRASRVPAMDCGWENLVSDRSKQCFASDTISIGIKSKWIVGILSIHNLSVKLVVEIAAIHIAQQGENITKPELSTLYIFLIGEKNSCCATQNQNYPKFKPSSTRLKLNRSAIGSFTEPRRISIGSSHACKNNHSSSYCNNVVWGCSRRQQSGHSDFQIRLKFSAKRYSSHALHVGNSDHNAFLATGLIEFSRQNVSQYLLK